MLIIRLSSKTKKELELYIFLCKGWLFFEIYFIYFTLYCLIHLPYAFIHSFDALSVNLQCKFHEK